MLKSLLNYSRSLPTVRYDGSRFDTTVFLDYRWIESEKHLLFSAVLGTCHSYVKVRGGAEAIKDGGEIYGA